ncbi:hypothetical protein PFFCH_05219 [Plasmodium falciparum FCH/4]|uniref:Uncharacterized protein n=1 Tax=Plasmodium falciparum FCH/4 TaxID=1036724 RepID=A0A024VG84_PLAFA|nr:hypothetical protein PFFCH_05219 [Plasmodium falciparum FCH/4]
MMKRYNLKYCCDDVSVFPSSTLINHDNNKFSEYFGLTAISTYQLKNKEPNEEPKKKGKIYLFGLNQNIKDDDNNNCEIDYYLEYKKNINFHNGVLQSNYIFTNDKLYLGSVCVNGFYLSDLKEETYEKLNNSVDNLLVAACDGGAKIFKKSNNDFIYDKGIFNNNELTYGIDVIDMLRPKNEKKKIYLSCSFYNKEVQLWD